MRRLQKSKKVSWASDVSLRQEKLFLSEDPPSQVGQRPQNQLQAKKKANGLFYSHNHFPYRLQLPQPPIQTKLKRPAVGGLPKWQCPPTFMLKPNWLNVAGEESKERQVQKQREMRVLEAFYPQPSFIPPNPSVSTEVKDSYYDDLLTPIIRITPIEDDEEEEVVNPSSHFEEEPVNIPIRSSKPSILTQLERNLLAAINFNSEMTSNAKQEENLIDFDLLLEILKTPKMLETLITDFGKPSSGFESAPKPSSPPTMKFSTPYSSCLAPANINSKEQLGTTSSAAPTTNAVVAPTSILNAHSHGFSHVSSSPMVKSPSPSLAATVTNIVAPFSNPNVPPPPHGFSHISTTPVVKASPPPTPTPTPPLKDIHYYKSLIQQHGKERPKGHDQKFRKFGKNKRKRPNLTVEPKPVMNSNQRKPRGPFWKGGANYAAAYQPDISFGQSFNSTTIPQVHCAKRMKLNQEILGRT